MIRSANFRRIALGLAAGTAALTAASAASAQGRAGPAPMVATSATVRMASGFIETEKGVFLYYKDWGPRDAQPIVFHHGWPLSADEWDAQMLYFLNKGYRVIAHDRRGHGRSTQTDTGNDMDHYAADVAVLADRLDLKNAIHVGHSTGGGEVVRYVAHARPGRVAKAVLIGAVPPIMAKTAAYPNGLPMSVFDGFRSQILTNRAAFFRDVAAGPFYGFNRKGATVNQAMVDNWWRQGMMAGAKAVYDCVKAFSETDFTDDLKQVSVPVLVLHGGDDQVVPIDNSSKLAAKLLRHGTLKVYPGLSHGMATTHPDVINADMLAFIKQ